MSGTGWFSPVNLTKQKPREIDRTRLGISNRNYQLEQKLDYSMF
jgi:hypothetical protein